MERKNMRRVSVLITAQSEYHLHRMAKMAGYKEIGRVIDKLVRDRVVSLNVYRGAKHGKE